MELPKFSRGHSYKATGNLGYNHVRTVTLPQLFSLFLDSYTSTEGMHSIPSILSWIEQRKSSLEVSIDKIALSECEPWFYDQEAGVIRNSDNSFFSIGAVRKCESDVVMEQPILLQKEIGYLGIICCVIDGMLHFLMQAKIEPGNINVIQISPTLQATKSNFLVKHGGSRPKYLEYFLNANVKNLIVDQIQSEQSSRFLGKRNRNVILYAQEYVEELDGYKWMTLGQLRQFLRDDNLVNMDTRTVLSCIPWTMFDDNEGRLLWNASKGNVSAEIVRIYQHLNDYKMHTAPSVHLIPISSLSTWSMAEYELSRHSGPSSFKGIFCDITIEGREVKHWKQPMFESLGPALFGLMYVKREGQLKILVKARAEIGCFDLIEIGPTVQKECVEESEGEVEDWFFTQLENKSSKVVVDVMQSEEGGRFYHEQNRNVIIEMDSVLDPLPPGYFWCSFETLNHLVQINNCLNIQLRNLLALLEIFDG